jgi:hypothetical protein
MNAFGSFGLTSVGFVAGIVAAPAAALALAWVLHGRKFDRGTTADVAIAAVAAVAIAAGGYAVVVALGLEDHEVARYVALGLLGLEAIVVAALLLGALVDLAERRSHRALDYVRLLAVVPIALALALFWTTPDFGARLVVVAPLALCGGVAALIGDATARLRQKATDSRSSGGAPTVTA